MNRGSRNDGHQTERSLNLAETEPVQPIFDPLSPKPPSTTVESDEWLLEQALQERRAHIRARARRVTHLLGRRRLLGGSSALRSFALNGEIQDLRDRLAQAAERPTIEVMDQHSEGVQ